MKILIISALMLALSACSSIKTTEHAVVAGVLSYGAVSTLSDGKIDNYGTTHALTSYGLILASEELADTLFPSTEQEVFADILVTAMALGSAAYWYDREPLDSFDSKTDVYAPTGVSLWKIWERWTKEQ